MVLKTVRNIVRINEDKCNGCGVYVPSCAEGALQIVDGKARLVSEVYCDGLGACLGECPQGAITIEERDADQFDEEATRVRLEQTRQTREEDCACASANAPQVLEPPETDSVQMDEILLTSHLEHWPVQLTLVPTAAPFLQDANLVVTADCVPFAYPGFHRDFLKDHAVVVACPKLDDFQAHLTKLTEILRHSSVRSIKVVRMEVPCCSGLVHMARKAVEQSGRTIPVEEAVIGVRGEILSTA